MRRSSVIIVVLVILYSCTVENEDRRALINDQVRMKLTNYGHDYSKKCGDRALKKADALVDSSYKSNPLKFLNDSTLIIPVKPDRPNRPDFKQWTKEDE